MAVATPVDAAVNPNDTAQRYLLWGNGRIDAIGGAPPVSDNQTWYTRTDNPARAIHVTDWTTGSGYVLDFRGRFSPFGGAPVLGTDGIISTVPYTAAPNIHRYIHWAWDPAGSGQGYVLDVYGELLPFGGATPTTRTGPRFPSARARKVYMQWTPSKKALVMDMHGRLYGDYFTAVTNARPTTLGAIGPDIARDFQVTSWTTGAGHVLDSRGRLHAFNGAATAFGYPYRAGADVARVLRLLSSSDPMEFVEFWAGGQEYEFVSSTAPTVTAGGGSSEVQRVTITGTPTGGTFTLTYSGQTTAAIARNASASTVQTALRALSNIGSTGVTVTGGPGPGTPWVVSFGGSLALTDVAQMTATSSLTGGSSPAVTVTTSTPGEATSPPATVTDTTRPVLTWFYSDAQNDSQAAWQVLVFTQAFASGHTMTNPLAWTADALVAIEGVDRMARGVTSPVDLPDGQYRMYVRAKDTAGQWSDWDDHGWTQDVPEPTTPTSLIATEDQDEFSVDLSVSATTGGSADLVRFEFSDDGGTTWATVRGAGEVTLATTTTATDYDIPLDGTTRTYRARAYAVDPAVVSAASNTDTASIEALTYVVRAVDDPTLGGEFRVQEPVEWTRPVGVGVFQGLGSEFATVVSDGIPKSRRSTLNVFTDSAADWQRLEALAESDSVLVYRDPHGNVRYCKLAGDWRASLMAGAAERHLYDSELPLVEVENPDAD